MCDFDVKKVLPMLRAFGVSPDRLGPEKMELLQKLSETVSDPEKIGTNEATSILRALGVGGSGPLKPKSGKIKIGRNEKCPCGSNFKYKQCCIP